MGKMLRRSLFGGLALLATGAVVMAMRPRPIPVDLSTATLGPMRWTVDEEGQTRIKERYVVSSPLAGRLRRITLDPGDPVRHESTVLAVVEPTDPALLDPRSLAEADARVRAADAGVRQAEAVLARRDAEHQHARKELERIIAASEEGAASVHELDDVETAERTAAEELRAARFALEIQQHELEVTRSALLYARGEAGSADQGQMRLYSPIDGAVLRVFQESVAVVEAGTELIEVGNPTDLELIIDVLSTDAVKINPGNRVIVDHWGGEAPLEGVVRLVEPSAFTKISALGIEEQRVYVIVDLVTAPTDRPTLGDRFRVEASIIVWEGERVLQIPTSALFRDGAEWAVFQVVDGRAVVRPVGVGRQNGRTTQLLDGLAEHDEVVLHPSDQLRDGVRVEPRSTP